MSLAELRGYTARDLPLDDLRGTEGMLLFIASEALLFLMLFFSYFYLGRNEPRWPMDPPPALTFALIMLGILAASSVTLFVGERAVKAGRQAAAKAWVGLTVGLGLAFLTLQVLEYRHHLEELKPTTDTYGSIFYTITSVHGLHLILGLLMLGYILLLPKLEPTHRPPHRPLHNAALYWHFVDLVWFVIVAVLYVAPNLGWR